ncbi:hypothetical protein J2Y83_001500 [Pseudomonas marginalis]|uniref:formyltransferase family protein n=1 Tax=Pseudomonas marginalis TaxID=298 RepID=UPI00209FBE73|nr:formyltransferase family protein [Pseudomonas marginalis]MCP1505527.1 hypothetical protein [Pseudomonas marginalis]MCP1523031.1 hypothetical protein [Pseudomonas marginalis]MDQ0497651.1 hypothetical protein [Pseudomonas marginalis]
MMIERFISNYLPATPLLRKQDAYFDTASVLLTAAEPVAWADDVHHAMEFLSKRVEISKCLYESYQESGAKASTSRLTGELQLLALALLFKDFRRLASNGSIVCAIKRLNAVLKLLDSLGAENIVVDPSLASLINTEAEKFLTTFPSTDTPPPEMIANTQMPANTGMLPITVLFWEGPIARAYLATLKSMGLKPEKIIQLVSKNDLVSRKPIGRFLPGNLKLGYAQSRQKNSIHYWSRTLRKTEAALCDSIINTVKNKLFFSDKDVDDALALGDLSSYSPDVETLMIESLADDALYDRLRALPQTQILFTGGGIVPRRLLEITTLKFIHIHPGHLPEIRGADCVLWSHLIKGRTSATCFYMTPGIDDGDIILASYLPSLAPHHEIANIDVRTLYRATYAFLDPWVRSFVLRRALVETVGFTQIAALSQDEDASVTYHFMHDQIKRRVFAQLFTNT